MKKKTGGDPVHSYMSKEDPVFNGMSPMPVILVFIYSVDIMYILLIGRAQCMKWFLIFSGGKETQ